MPILPLKVNHSGSEVSTPRRTSFENEGGAAITAEVLFDLKKIFNLSPKPIPSLWGHFLSPRPEGSEWEVDLSELAQRAEEKGTVSYEIKGIGVIQKSILGGEEDAAFLNLFPREMIEVWRGNSCQMVRGTGLPLEPGMRLVSPKRGLKIIIIDSTPMLKDERPSFPSSDEEVPVKISQVEVPHFCSLDFMGELGKNMGLGFLFLGAEALYKIATGEKKLSGAEQGAFAAGGLSLGTMMEMLFGELPLSAALSATVAGMVEALPYFYVSYEAFDKAGVKGNFQWGPVAVDKKALLSLPLGTALLYGVKRLLPEIVGGTLTEIFVGYLIYKNWGEIKQGAGHIAETVALKVDMGESLLGNAYVLSARNSF